jgi:hypothetical protein
MLIFFEFHKTISIRITRGLPSSLNNENYKHYQLEENYLIYCI